MAETDPKEIKIIEIPIPSELGMSAEDFQKYLDEFHGGKIENLLEEYLEKEKAEKKATQRLNREKQKAAKAAAKENVIERRARVHRFCEIGGGIESNVILGRPLTEEDVPLIISFLADQESKNKSLSSWIQDHKPEKKSKEIFDARNEKKIPEPDF